MSKLSTLDHTFGGNKVSQSWHDLFIWEQILNQYPPARIIELGTFTGGMSVYLHVQAALRGATFRSYDIDHYKTIREQRKDSPFTSKWLFPFTQLDVQKPEDIATVAKEIQRDDRTVLFCDNGNKEEEARIYTPHLKKDDILAVHDWGTECRQVPAELTLIEPIDGIYDELESMTRFFIK